MATYMALVSLMNVLNRIQLPTCPVSFNQSKIQSLFDQVSYLVDFLEVYSQRISNDFATRTIAAAFAAEDTIECYLVDQILARSAAGDREVDHALFCENLEKAIQDMYVLIQEAKEVEKRNGGNDQQLDIVMHADSSLVPAASGMNKMIGMDKQLISLMDHAPFCENLEKAIQYIYVLIQEAKEVEKRNGGNDQQLDIVMHADSSLVPAASGMNKMVGMDKQLISLMDQLTSYQVSRLIIPLVGMGGIGKTTLAINVYNDSCVRNHFEIRLWVTITQNHTMRSIVSTLLGYFGVQGRGNMTNGELGDQLYKNLFDRKYLVILDDVWSNVPLDEVRRFLPDNNNGSRILLTTRLLSVAVNVGSCSPFVIKLLDDDESWSLLSQTIFGNEACPRHLEKLGKQIANSCKGLPLSIVVIGGLLKMSPKTQNYWYDVKKNVISITSTETQSHCLGILSLSYNHLPIHLKPCFLYMATFIENGRMSTTELINLWVADGLLKPTKGRNQEDLALENLCELMKRNLIMPPPLSLSGRRIEYCSMHDSLRGFCLKEAKREMFLYPIFKTKLNLPQKLQSARRLVYHPSGLESNLPLPPMPHARSFYCDKWSSPTFSTCCSLLRVLRVYSGKRLQIDTTQLVNLRYLACQVNQATCEKLLSSISLFWNLEVLIVSGTYTNLTLPSEFWEFTNLKCLIFANIILPDPANAKSFCVLDNLRVLKNVKDFDCTDAVLDRITNLRILSLYYGVDNPELVSRTFINLARHGTIETLRCEFLENEKDVMCIFELEKLKFSPSLKELELSQSNIPWESMTIIGSLPNLEVLTLGPDAFRGEEWNPIEEEFKRLKSLSVSGCNLRFWRADSSHFPRLEHLFVDCLNLEEIPLEMEEIASLTLISLNSYKKSLVLSANEILQQREGDGSHDLLVEGVYILDRDYSQEEELKEKALMLEMQMASNNFQVQLFDHKAGRSLDLEEFLSNTKKRLVDMWKLDGIGGKNIKKQIIEARRYTQYKCSTEFEQSPDPALVEHAITMFNSLRTVGRPGEPDTRAEWLQQPAVEVADMVDAMYNLHTREIQFGEIRNLPAVQEKSRFIDQMPEASDSRAKWIERKSAEMVNFVDLMQLLHTRRMQNLPAMTQVIFGVLRDAILDGSIFTSWREIPRKLANLMGVSHEVAVLVVKAVKEGILMLFIHAVGFSVGALLGSIPVLVLVYVLYIYGFLLPLILLYFFYKAGLLFPYLIYLLPSYGPIYPFRLYVSSTLGLLLPYLLYVFYRLIFG